MKNYRLLTFLFILIFLSGMAGNLWRHPRRAAMQTDCPDCLALFPQAKRISPKIPQPPHYQIFANNPLTGQEELLGIAFHTNELAPNVRGFSGPIDLLLGLDPQGRIVGLKVVSHSETSSYVSALDSFLKQFTGRSPANPLKIGTDIDAITGATITSTAVAKAVKESLDVATRQILNIAVTPAKKPGQIFPIEQIVGPVVLFILAVAGIISRSLALRRMALLGGFIYLGLIKKHMVAAIQIANIGLGNIPPFTDSPLWHLLLLLTVAGGFLLGMVYCNSVCPFSSVQEFLFALGRRVRLPQGKISADIDGRTRYLKHVILLVTIGLSLLLSNPDIANVEVYVTFFTRQATPLAWLFLFLMLGGSLFYFRFWCKYFCPIGALNGLISNLSLFKIRVQKTCNSCQTCRRLCPTEAITFNADKTPLIDYPECILCNRCVRGCPQFALKLDYVAHEKN